MGKVKSKAQYRFGIFKVAVLLAAVTVVFVGFFGFIAALSIAAYFDDAGKQATIDSGVIVEAEIVDSTHASTVKESRSRRRLVYEYYDEDNRRYTGHYISVAFDEADKYIGQKIEIFIDGKGNSIPVGFDPGVGVDVAVSVIFSVACFVSLVVSGIVFYNLFRNPKKAEQKQGTDAEASPDLDVEDQYVTNEIEQSVPENLEHVAKKFTLTVQGVDAVDVENPKLKDLEHAMSVLKSAPETFLVLASSVPVDDFNFVQATGFEDGKCHAAAQRRDGKILHIFGTDDMTEEKLLNILKDFLADVVPDISGWAHVGDYKQK